MLEEQARFRFGRFCFDPRNRVLTRDEAIVRLSPKTVDLLLYLVMNRGRANTRTELMEALWPGVFVEEGSLAFQISALRKALGEDGGAWIETVPKHGYRFSAPVVIVNPSPPAPALPTLSKTRLHPAAIVGCSACLALVLAGGFAYHRWPSSDRSPRAGDELAAALPLTSYPGYESDPSLSPDGSQVAFSWTGPNDNNRDIYIKLVGDGEPVRITSDPDEDVSPQWSPDGRWIAYVSRMGGESSLMLVPALGGAKRRLAILPAQGARYGAAPCHFLAWTPDSKGLIIPFPDAGQKPDSQTGLALLDIDSARLVRLTNAPSHHSADRSPVVSPDGKRLAFLRVQAYRSHIIMVQDLGPGYEPAGSPVSVLQPNSPVGGLSWTADSNALVYSAGGDIGVRYLELLQLSGSTAKSRSKLVAGEQATTTSIRQNRLVYTKVVHDSNIWSYPIDLVAARLNGPQKRLAASSQEDYQGELSPDGRTLAFVSSRSGFAEIWIANADGSSPKQMTRTQGPKTAGPHWSPDGKKILFDSQEAGKRYLYLLHLATGEVQKLPQGTDAHRGTGRWSPDGEWIYFTGFDEKGMNIFRTSAKGGPANRLSNSRGGAPVVSPDGEWIYFAKAESTPTAIWKVRTDGSGETEVFRGVSYGDNFVVTSRGIYFVGIEPPQNGGGGPRLTTNGAGQATLEYFEFVSGKRTLLHKIGKSFWYGCTLSPDGRNLLVAQVDEEGSDLMLVERYRR